MSSVTPYIEQITIIGLDPIDVAEGEESDSDEDMVVTRMTS